MKEAWDDPYTCPICKMDDCVPATGKKSSKILIIGEFPGKDEIRTGKPFSGATGRVLQIELARVGIDIKSLRLCNVWHHVPTDNEACYQYGFNQAIQEAKGKDAILLIGSDVVKKFCNEKVSEVSGLQVTSPYLSAPLIMACLQPANVFNNVIGDFRLSLQKFAKKLEDLPFMEVKE